MIRFRKVNETTFQLGRKQACVEAFFTFFVSMMINSVMAAIIYYGSRLSEKGEITVGQITSFLLYMIQLIFNFAIVAIVIANVFKVVGASQKVVSLMKHRPKVNSKGGDVL